MAHVTGEKGFVPAYWRSLRNDKTDPTIFFSKFDHFLRFLEEYGILEHPEGCSEVDADFMAIRDYSSPLEGMYGPGTKRREVIEHDAKMRLLIERLRAKSSGATYTDVRYWFITESTRLPTYARLPVGFGASKPAFPFCVLSSTWAQIVRAMVPRTDDLDAMIVGLLASPYVGYKPAAQDREAVERVVARIDALKDVPPSVAIAVVNDRAMATMISGETNSHEVDRLVEEAISQKARELEEQIVATATRATVAERERAQADEKARVAEEQARVAEEQARLAEEQAASAVLAHQVIAQGQAAADAEVQVERAGHSSIEAGLRQELHAIQSREAEERNRRLRAEARAKHMRNGIAVGCAILVGATGAALVGTATVTGGLGIIAIVALTIVIAYIALRLISDSLAKEAVVIVTIVVGVVTAAAALFPETPSQQGKPTQAPPTTK